jgi:hypothetical protein
MQVLARCPARQQADKRRDLGAKIRWAARAVGWLGCRLGFPHWFLVDVHASAFCLDARATCSS